MRIETTYFAFDDTEFDSAEECRAYEEALNYKINISVLFFDGDLNRMSTDTYTVNNIAEGAMYMKVVEGDKATELMKWMYNYTGVCMDGLPDTLHDGEVWVWNNDSGEWYNPMEQYEKLRMVVEGIEKAVSEA